MIADQELWVRVELHLDAALPALRWFLRDHGAVWLAGRDVGEIAGRPGSHRVHVDIAHDGHDRVVGSVVLVEVLERGAASHGLDLARHADHRPPVGVGSERRPQVLLQQHAERLGFDAQPPFFHHDFPLGVELAQHRVAQPVAFEHEPQLGAVRGQGEEVVREVITGAGVEAHGAVLGEDAVELVAHHVLPRCVLELLEPVAQPLQLRAVGQGALTELGGERIGHGVDAREERLLDGDVLRADRPAALEQHVLEQVGGAGDAGPLVDPARAEVRHERDGWGAGSPQEQERHAVGEDVLHNSEALAGSGGLLLLRGSRCGEQDNDQPVQRMSHDETPVRETRKHTAPARPG